MKKFFFCKIAILGVPKYDSSKTKFFEFRSERVKANGKRVLQLCCSNGECIMKTVFNTV